MGTTDTASVDAAQANLQGPDATPLDPLPGQENPASNANPFDVPAGVDHRAADGAPVIGYRHVEEPDQSASPHGCHVSISSGLLVEDIPGALQAYHDALAAAEAEAAEAAEALKAENAKAQAEADAAAAKAEKKAS